MPKHREMEKTVATAAHAVCAHAQLSICRLGIFREDTRIFAQRKTVSTANKPSLLVKKVM